MTSILEQHAQNAAFLWTLREKTLTYPHFTLEDLAKLDERIEANIDGLRIGGEAGWSVCEAELSRWGDEGEYFLATVLAVEREDISRFHALKEAAFASPKQKKAMISAMGWLSWSKVETLVHQLSTSNHSLDGEFALACYSVHRRDPGSLLATAIKSQEAVVQARALRCIGELGLRHHAAILRDFLKHPDEVCRFWAAWSGTLLAVANASSVLSSFCKEPGPFAEIAMVPAARAIDPAHRQAWLEQRCESKELQRQAVFAAGACGSPALIEWIFQKMQIPALARVAGEAFTLITGTDLAQDPFKSPAPDGFVSGPTEDPEDENIELDPDEHSPWPDVDALRSFWQKHQHELYPDDIYIVGQPVTKGSLLAVLRSGGQRQRSIAALTLLSYDAKHPLFNTRAPALRQQQILAQLSI